MRFVYLFIITMGFLAGCPQPLPEPLHPKPVPNYEEDGGIYVPDAPQVVTNCLRMCDNLTRLDCPEGNRGNCISTCIQIIEKRFIVLDPVCVSAAVSKEGVRACGIACKTPIQ